MEDLIPYIDLMTLGIDLIDQRKAKITEYGVLCRIDEGMESLQEEEEFHLGIGKMKFNIDNL